MPRSIWRGRIDIFPNSGIIEEKHGSGRILRSMTMNRENKKRQYEKGYYKTHACDEAFTCKITFRVSYVTTQTNSIIQLPSFISFLKFFIGNIVMEFFL